MAEKWPCPACTFLNEATYANCDVCQEPRQKAARRPLPPKRPAPPIPAPAPRTEKRRRRVVETPSDDESDGEVLAAPPRTVKQPPAPPRRVSPDTIAGAPAPAPARPDAAALRSEWRRLCEKGRRQMASSR